LSYLGRVSGRDEDKVAGAGLTVEFTELGNPIYAEADLAIECRKIYGQQFDPSLMPQEQRDWYDRSGLGVHYMYIGEIVHVWKK
jgi:flavin reductase (DIM6/NTAB) family NADH-FMN oxidoreductase RutF